jgi:hypothetical protein
MNLIFSIFLFVKIYLFFTFIYYKKYGTIPNCLLIISCNLSYNSIYYYSKLQLEFMKTTNNITKYIKTTPCLNNLLNYINQNNNKNIYTYININNYLTICSKFNQEENLDYKLILHYNPDYEKKNYLESLKVEEADYKFIMTEITINNKNISVHFTNEKYNYLIVYNKFDKNFINYFLKTHYTDFVKDLSDSEIENYKIKIIDHNVNVVELDNTNFLIINKTGYEILKINNHLLTQYK